MEYRPTDENLSIVRPTITYEGTIFAQAAYRDENVRISPEATYITGFDAIDAHTEQLLEQWETQHNLDSAIDALTIIESFPEHFDPLSPQIYDTLTRQIQSKLEVYASERGGDAMRSFFVHLTQLSRIYREIEAVILAQLDGRQHPIDEIIAEPLVGAFLDAYAECNLSIDRQGRVEALYQLLIARESH